MFYVGLGLVLVCSMFGKSFINAIMFYLSMFVLCRHLCYAHMYIMHIGFRKCKSNVKPDHHSKCNLDIIERPLYINEYL